MLSAFRAVAPSAVERDPLQGILVLEYSINGPLSLVEPIAGAG